MAKQAYIIILVCFNNDFYEASMFIMFYSVHFVLLKDFLYKVLLFLGIWFFSEDLFFQNVHRTLLLLVQFYHQNLTKEHQLQGLL